MSLSIVILAAGQGIRMHSELPKVLHRLAGKTMLEHVYNSASLVNHRQIYVVYGYGGDRVKNAHAALDAEWILQKKQLGTGHAVKQALPHIIEQDHVMILYGDIPMLTSETLDRRIEKQKHPERILLDRHH